MNKLLTKDNYFDPENNIKYMSCSQYKTFMKCEALAMARLSGYDDVMTTSLLAGKFVDSHFDNSLDKLKEEYPEMFSTRGATKGQLKSIYKHAELMIARVERDEMMMKYMSGEKQKIFTAEMFGVEWKIMIDSYSKGICITDFKTTKDMKSLIYWNYDIQGAIYQKITEIVTGEKLPFFLDVVTKEPVPDIGIFHIQDYMLENTLAGIKENLPHIIAVKNGIIEPERCEKCDYCKLTKQAKVRYFDELMEV